MAPAATLNKEQKRHLLLTMLENKVALPSANKARVMAAAWARRNYELPELLFTQHEFSIADLLRAVEMLDYGRECAMLQRKIDRLRQQAAAADKIAKVRDVLQNLRANSEGVGSLSGAARKRIASLIRSIPADRLEFYLLNFPMKPWQRLADLLHLAPRDFALSWFLACVYGAGRLKNNIYIFEK